MKKRLLSVAFLMGAIAANAQVGIGTANPNKSAELLIESKNRGLLIPNVELKNTTDKSTITNGNVESLLVYATKKQNDVAPGYHYWHINKWERLTADSDIPQIVVNQFEDILNKDGDKVKNIIKNLIKATETLTVLAYNPVTGTLTYTDEKGLATTVDVKGAVKSFETVTSISTDAAAGTITFIAEDGKPTVLDIASLVKANETVTTLTREKAGKYIYKNEAGTLSEITVIGDVTEVIKNKVDQDLYNVLKTFVDVEETLTQLVYNASTKKLIFSDEDDKDHEIDVEALVKANQLVTSIAPGTNIQVTEVKEGNTISYTLDVPTASKEVAGVVKPGSGLDIDAAGNLTVNLETALNAKDLSGNDKIVVTDGKGAVLKTTTLDINEKAIKLENLGGTLNLTQLQAGEAGDVLVVNDKGEVVWSAKNAITTNTLVLKGADLVSTVNGVESVQTLKDKLTTEMLQNGSVTAEKLGAEAKDAGKVPVAQADGSVVYQNISSEHVDGKALTSANALLTVSNTAGVVLKDVVLTIDQTKYDLAQIGGTLQLTQIAKGNEGQVLVTDIDGKVKWVSGTSDVIKDLVKSNESVTTLVDNGDGTFTYFNEADYGKDGVLKPGAKGVEFNANTLTVKSEAGVYTFTDKSGAELAKIDTNAGAITFNDNTTNLGVTNVQGAIEKLLEKITTVEGTKGNLTGEGIVVSDTQGVILKDVVLSIGVGAITNEKLADKSVSADKMTSFTTDNGTKTPVGEGQIPVADGKGGVTYKEISGETLKGKALTSGSISVFGGDKALLGATKIEITGGKNKGEVLVTTDTPLTNDKGEIVKDPAGNTVYVTEWQNPKDFVSDTVTASNGVTVTNNAKDGNSEFKLGGYLTEPTVIDTKENTLAIANMDSVEKGKVLENSLVIADKDGVLKQTSAKNLIEEAVEVGELKAKALTTDGVIVIGNDNTSTTVLAGNSLLADVKLNIGKDKITEDHIATGAVTSDEILDGAIQAIDMKSTGNSKVLVTGADGVVQWIDQSTLNNKDTFNGNAPISIVEGAINTTGGKEYNINVANANGTTAGVTKQAEVDPTIIFNEGIASVNIENIAKTQGKALTSKSILVKDGDKSLLKDVNIEIKGGTSEGQVLVSTPELGIDGKPTVDETGKPIYITKWVDADKVGVEVTNGIQKITETDGTTKLGLGGILTEPTVIDTKENTLAIANMDSVEKGKVLENNLVIADKDGVLKQTSAKNLIEDAVGKGDLVAKQLKGAGITVTAGDKEGTDTSVASSLLKDVTLGIANGAVTQDKLYAGTKDADGKGTPAMEGTVPVANADGTVTYKNVSTALGADLTTDGKIVIGDTASSELKKAVLVATKLSIKEGSITTTEILDGTIANVDLGVGAVTSDKMKATVTDGTAGSKNAEAGMVPVANADGTVTYNKLDSKDVTYAKPTTGGDNGLTSNTVEGVINELAGKKGDLSVAGGMLKVDESAKGALRHDATISLDLSGVNKIVETKVDYMAKVEDVIILALATQGDLTVTLPEATTNKGKKYTIKKHDTNEDGYVIVEGNITGVEQGEKLETGLPYSGWDFVSDGTQWQIVNKF